MQTVFSTRDLKPSRRADAWRSALCDVYLQVDASTYDREDYTGYVREAQYGQVYITEALLSAQDIKRRTLHMARLDKDCYFLQFVLDGRASLVQRKNAIEATPCSAEFFNSTEPYDLSYPELTRAIFLEIPKVALEARVDSGTSLQPRTFRTVSGVGRLTRTFFTSLVAQDEEISIQDQRLALGEQALDLLALALTCPDAVETETVPVVRKMRLAEVKAYIDANLSNPNLSVSRIARDNDISISYIHKLFQAAEMSVSEWIWDRRLKRCFDQLQDAPSRYRTLTELAYDNGFNSSSHFSTQFKRKYGVSPSELRRECASAPLS